MEHNLNLKDTHRFFLEYFDGTHRAERSEHCSTVKAAAIQAGQLAPATRALSFGEFSLSNDHPMNGAIRRFLPLFRARLQVFLWETQKSAPSISGSLQATRDNGHNTRAHVPHMRKQADTIQSKRSKTVTSNQAQSTKDLASSRPGKDAYHLARQLEDHSVFRTILGEFISSDSWPENDRVAVDRVHGYDPYKTLAEMQKAADKGKKGGNVAGSEPVGRRPAERLRSVLKRRGK